MNLNNNKFAYTVIGALFASLLFMYFPTLSVLHVNWSEMHRAYAHGYLILVLMIYLLYNSRHKIFQLKQEENNNLFVISLFGMLFCSIAWFLAFLVQIQIVQLVAVVVLMWLWMAAVFGKSSALYTLMPFFLLLTAVPIWEGTIPSLQLLTIYATKIVLSWFGVIAYIEGYYIYLVDGTLEVAEECSGLKYLVAGLALGIVYAELNIHSIRRKIIAVLLAVFISIIANWIRVISLTLVADISNMQSSLLSNHDSLGWVVFALCFAIYLVVIDKVVPGYEEVDEKIEPRLADGEISGSYQKYYVRAFSATLLVSVLPYYSLLTTNHDDGVLQSHFLQMDAASKKAEPSWVPDYMGYDGVEAWSLMVGAREIEITILSYSYQDQGKELIYFRNKLNDASHQLTNIDSLELSENLNVNRSLLSNSSSKMLVGWFYKVGSYATNDSTIAKLMQIPSIFNGETVASLVTVSVVCANDDCQIEKDNILSKVVLKGITKSIEIQK